MTNLSFLLLLLLPLLCTSISLPDRFLFSSLTPSSEPQEYFDPTLPPFLNPTELPACSILILNHSFANTYGLPPTSAVFSPLEKCPPPWSSIVLDLSVSCTGDQYDRIAAVWIDGVEILRTSTVEPTKSGVFWRVRKDITRYASLFRRSGGAKLSMMMENIVDEVYTGIYRVNVTVEFYSDSYLGDEEVIRLIPMLDDSADVVIPVSRKDGGGGLGLRDSGVSEEVVKMIPLLDDQADAVIPVSRKDGGGGFRFRDSGLGEGEVRMIPLLDDPADVVIPVSSKDSRGGFWFRIKKQSEAHYGRITIPRNAFRAVLEVYVSFHSNDEFWYWNPPDVYIKKNKLKTEKGNGAFREVFATIDGRFVGTVLPFPVVFTGGINPLFWAPVVAIGAFDLPSYNLDLTPFLELLLDGKKHSIGLRVTDGISFWLVDANLHLWLDSDSKAVSAKLVRYQAPPFSVDRNYNFQQLNGTFEIEAERKVHFSGWVNSSMGNLTTDVNQKLKFKSSVEYQNNGNYKAVHMKAKGKTEVRIKEQEVILSRFNHKFKNPLSILTDSLPGLNNTYTMRTNLSHTLYEVASFSMRENLITSKILTDKQDASGWMQVQDHSVLSGSARTKQVYQYREKGKCYIRSIETEDGVLTDDTNNNACAHSF